MRLIDPMLLEGEPDGSGAAAPPTETPAPVEGQPAEPEGASVPEEGASEESPAPEEEEQPAPEDEGEPADELTDEDWEEIYKRYPDRDPRTAAEKAAAQAREEAKRQAENPERIRAQDPVFRRVAQQAAENRQQIDAAWRAIANGEMPENPEELLAHIDLDATYYQAAERQGQIAVNQATIEQMLGINGGNPDVSIPLHKQYDDARTELETAWDNSYRLLGQARREVDAAKRGNLVTRAMYDNAIAVGNFYRKTLEIAEAKGEQQAIEKAEKAAGRRVTAATAKARENGHTEAIAKAKAAVAGGRAMATAAVPSKPTGTDGLTLEESNTLPIEELKRRGYG